MYFYKIDWHMVYNCLHCHTHLQTLIKGLCLELKQHCASHSLSHYVHILCPLYFCMQDFGYKKYCNCMQSYSSASFLSFPCFKLAYKHCDRSHRLCAAACLRSHPFFQVTKECINMTEMTFSVETISENEKAE